MNYTDALLTIAFIWLGAVTFIIGAGIHLNRRPPAGPPHLQFIINRDGTRMYADCRCALGHNHER